MFFVGSEYNTTPRLEDKIEAETGLEGLDSVSSPHQISEREEEKLREFSNTLHGTYLQGRRMSHFAFEPVSLPPSRVRLPSFLCTYQPNLGLPRRCTVRLTT